jgi:hypothetical protein
MSSEVLRELDRRKAFTPAPSLWEMAQTHVPFAELGFAAPPEATARGGLTDGSGLLLVRGDSGGGKSTTLAYVAAKLAGETTPTGRGAICRCSFPSPAASRRRAT